VSPRYRTLRSPGRRLSELHMNDGTPLGLQIMRQAAYGEGVKGFDVGLHGKDSR